MRLMSDRTRAALAARLYGVRLPKINLRWPASRTNNLVPWYTILWRLIWWLPLVASTALAIAILAVSQGPSADAAMWRDLR